MARKPKVIFITGPTASGKSALAIWLAGQIDGGIINADSRQVYRCLDAGSGKVNPAEEKIVPHYLLSVASPKRNFSLGQWLKLADKTVAKLQRVGQTPIFCGGTMLYLRALQEGWVLPNVSPNYRLRRRLEKLSTEKLLLRLYQLAPGRATTVEPRNRRRLIRALEIAGKLGQVPQLVRKPKYEILSLAPAVSLEKLKSKIRQRLKERLPQIVKEIKNLRQQGLSLSRLESFGLAYKWFSQAVKGQISLTEAFDHCFKDEIQFAKRQLAELKKVRGLQWVKNKREALSLVKSFIIHNC